MTALAALEVTDNELGSLAGVSARRIRQLAENGTLARTGQNKYPLGESVRALLEDAAGSGSEINRQRTRKIKADADRAELELALARKEIAPIEEMARVWQNVMAHIRINMLNIPGRVVTQILGETSETRLKTCLKNEIVLALTSATSVDVKDLEEESE